MAPRPQARANDDVLAPRLLDTDVPTEMTQNTQRSRTVPAPPRGPNGASALPLAAGNERHAATSSSARAAVGLERVDAPLDVAQSDARRL